MEIKAKINKRDLIKLKRFCTTKKTTSKVKKQPSEWEKIIANEATDKELISKIQKQIQESRCFLLRQILKSERVKVARSCLTLCDPMDYIVHGILQARPEYWIGRRFLLQGIKPRSPALQEDSLPVEPPGKPADAEAEALILRPADANS